MRHMLYKEEPRTYTRSSKIQASEKPPHAEEFKACLQQALKLLEERYEV